MTEPSVKIHVLSTVNQLEVTYGDDQSMLWSYSTWGTLKSSTTNIMFGHTNAFIATWSKKKQDALWQAYLDARDIIEMIGELNEIEAQLIEVANTIESLFTWDELYQWSCQNGILPDPKESNVRSAKDPEDTTYLRDEIHELVVFCLVLKLFMPIFGKYISLVDAKVGNVQKERVASYIFTKSNFANWKPFKRLVIYNEGFTRLKAKKIKSALAYGIPNDDLDSVFLGFILTRRLTIYPVGNKAAPQLIKFIYRFLEDKVYNLSNVGYTDKFANGDSSDPESNSKSDQYRISQNVSDDKPILADWYLDAAEFTRGIPELDGEEDAIIELALKLDQRKVYPLIPEIHTVLPALLFRHTISPILHSHIGAKPMDPSRPNSRMIAIAATAIYCQKNNYPDVASLLTAVREPGDARVMELEDKKIGLIRKISRDLNERLLEVYPLRSPSDIKYKTCPGKIMIDRIINEIRSGQWTGLEDIKEINNSLANFFIHAGRKPETN